MRRVLLVSPHFPPTNAPDHQRVRMSLPFYREHGWAPSTTKTLLRRLVEKGYLQARQVGNSFLYRPAQPAIKTLTGAADALLGNAVEGLVGPLLAHMVKTSSLSAEDLAQLRALLDEHTPPDSDP